MAAVDAQATEARPSVCLRHCCRKILVLTSYDS